MLRVYLDGKLAREAEGKPDEIVVDTTDRGRFVCGVELPAGRVLAGKPRVRRGRRVVRVDIRTTDSV